MGGLGVVFLYRHMRTEEGSTDEESLFITSKGAHTFGHSHPFLLSTSSRYLQALLFILTFTVLLPPLLVYSEFSIPPPLASHILSSVTQGGPRYHMAFHIWRGLEPLDMDFAHTQVLPTFTGHTHNFDRGRGREWREKRPLLPPENCLCRFPHQSKLSHDNRQMNEWN